MEDLVQTREIFANTSFLPGQNRRIMGRGDAADWSSSCDVAPKGRIEDSDGHPCGIKVGSLTCADSAPHSTEDGVTD